ncbi:MAG: hypothetical protein J0I12_02210 [Candidatus Eremiobacteraeota bacterium]|nr:hypothetical protein [Candidatus Eremiobacteraeota bacterium]
MAFGGIGPITNFNGAALDQQMFAVDQRIAQSTLLNGNLFGTLGNAQQSGLDAVFGGLGSLNFGIPGSIGFPAPGPIGFQAPAGIGFPDPGRIGFQAPSPLSLQIPQTIGFAQSMLGSLGGLSNGWAGIMGGSGFGAFGGGAAGGTRSCH